MKASKELVKHLSACLWYANEESISQILESFGGNPLDENPSTKHPIELVNECYPNGWCVEKCDEVIKDINSFYGATFLGECNFYGQIYRSYFASNSSWEIIITRSEYMAITRPQEVEKWQPKVGDLVEMYGDNESYGVFKGEYSHTTKYGFHYIKGNDAIGCKNIRPASNGVHIEQPKPESEHLLEVLQDCVNDLDKRVKQLESMQAPTLKRHL